jgi:hypothetical protein
MRLILLRLTQWHGSGWSSSSVAEDADGDEEMAEWSGGDELVR